MKQQIRIIELDGMYIPQFRRIHFFNLIKGKWQPFRKIAGTGFPLDAPMIVDIEFHTLAEAIKFVLESSVKLNPVVVWKNYV